MSTPDPTRSARPDPTRRRPRPIDPALAEQLEQYLGERYWPEDAVLGEVLADTAARGPYIQIGAEGGKVLGLLVTLISATKVLEVGTLFGYSGIWIARHLPPDGHLDTLEVEPLHADAAQHWFERAGVADRITIHRGRALDTLPKLQGPYDLVFIDADKPSYPQYAELGLQRLRPGGLLVLDNMIRAGQIVTPDSDPGNTAIRSVHDLLSSRADVLATTLPIRDGISVAIKLVPAARSEQPGDEQA